jgi:hypothetical protein
MTLQKRKAREAKDASRRASDTVLVWSLDCFTREGVLENV